MLAQEADPQEPIKESMMPMDAQEITDLIKQALPDSTVHVEDLRGDGDHFAAHVVSAAFIGKSRVQQHQIVYRALKGRAGTDLHALALQTSPPASPSSPE